MAIRTGLGAAAIAMVAIISVGDAALADDSGVHAFLLNMFGQAGQTEAPAPTPAPPVAVRHRYAHARPVTIRRQRPTVVAAVGPTKPGQVSIFTDPTLRPGDAVMMADGVRVFAGSRSWPYTKADFLSLDQAHDIDRDTLKVLAALNTVPRS